MTRRNSPSDPEAVAQALDRLSEELTVLRDVLDEICSKLQWANRNRPENEGNRWAVRRITSMPLDPAAPDGPNGSTASRRPMQSPKIPGPLRARKASCSERSVFLEVHCTPLGLVLR